MKKSAFLFFFLFSTLFSVAQRDCNLSKLPKESKDELILFWKTLTESLQLKDTTKLLSLCDFPFYVSKDLFSNDILDRGANFSFDSININKYTDSIFFDAYFELAVSACADPTKCLIFHGNYKQKHKTCGYVFCYPFKNTKGENEERCFSIIRFDHAYKLTGKWRRY